MVRQSVQFGFHQRDQLPERSFVTASPCAEQSRDLFSRARNRRHTNPSTS
jgi:hypothetical protein